MIIKLILIATALIMARVQYGDLGGDPNMAFFGIYKTSA